MQIKTTLRVRLTPERMSRIKNTNDNLCWRGCGEMEILLHCWWECKLIQSLWMSVWQFLRKLGNNLSQDSVIPLGYIIKNMCSTIFISALFVIVRTWKQPKCPSIEEWIRKVWYIYTMEYYTEEKKNNDIMGHLKYKKT